MALILIALLIGLPIIELTLFIEVGAEIGAGAVIGLTILTAVVGVWLARLQGFAVLNAMRQSMAEGRRPVKELAHGFFLLIAGISLVIPGFLTDALGALLLIPPIRMLLARFGMQRMVFGNPRPPTYRGDDGGIIIEGRLRHSDEDEDDDAPKS